MSKKKIAIIGGGAAGFFAAIQCKLFDPNNSVQIYEKTTKLLSKVKVSGGGRCNVTNAETLISTLSKAYPRGEKQLKKLLHEYSTQDIQDFFEDRGVGLYTQDDGRVFPKSNDSSTIIDCLMEECKKLDIHIYTSHQLKKIEIKSEQLLLHFNEKAFTFDRVIVCTGGHPKIDGYQTIKKAGQELVSPLPSLFTFNMPNEKIKSLMGISVENVVTKIEGEKLMSDGPLLITHWGMSGPAILKLSAFGARILAEKEYTFKVRINWTGGLNIEGVKDIFADNKTKWGATQLKNIKMFDLPKRLWIFLLEKIALNLEKSFDQLNKKELNKLIEILTNDTYSVSGKTTFKEEFVTAGGVDLSFIDLKTMESKIIPHLYYAGEVLNIDGITGGYNFQSAWTTAFVAARAASS